MNLKLCILFYLFSISLSAQDSEASKEAVYPKGIKHFAWYKNEAGPEITFKDTLKLDKYYIASIYWPSHVTSTCLVEDAGQHWVIHQIFDDYVTVTAHHWVNLIDKGRDQLILEYYYNSGRSGWQSGHSERAGGFVLLDLNSKRLLLEELDLQCYAYWENQLEYEDPNDPNSRFEILGSEGSFEQGFSVKAEVEIKKLTVTYELADCSHLSKDKDDTAEAEEILKKLVPIVYHWENGKMVIR